MTIPRVLILILSLFAVSIHADLDGRGDEAPPKRVAQRQQQQQQRQVQPPTPQYQEDTFEQLRNLSGRIDVVENQIGQLNAANSGEKGEVAKSKKELEGKFVAYEEALKKLEVQVAALSDEVIKLREDMSKKTDKPDKPEPKAGKKNAAAAYEEGENLLAQKKWREAIISFEEYRKNHPKGKHYSDATYKIGVCMQEIGMRAEAKLFYDEVVAKFPGSKEAKKATYRLKTLK